MEAGQVGDHLENAMSPVEAEKDFKLELVLLLVQITEERHVRALLLNLKGAT